MSFVNVNQNKKFTNQLCLKDLSLTKNYYFSGAKFGLKSIPEDWMLKVNNIQDIIQEAEQVKA